MFSQRAQHVNCLVMNGSYDCVDMKTMEKSTTTNVKTDLDAVEVTEHQPSHLHINVLFTNSQEVARKSGNKCFTQRQQQQQR